MHSPFIRQKNKGVITSFTLLLLSFASIFFPRFFSSLGAPSIINFAHFGIVPITTAIVILKATEVKPQQALIVGRLAFALIVLGSCMAASALLNQSGLINLFISFMLLAEPFILLMGLLVLTTKNNTVARFRKWVLVFALINLFLAIAQSILMPIGLYPRPSGGTLQDNIVGVFGGGGGSAGNYISCTISVYVGIYFLLQFRTVPSWLKAVVVLAALYQTQVSDSKQVFLALFSGFLLLVFTKITQIRKLVMYAILAVAVLWLFNWAVQNTDYQFLNAYRNFINRPIWGINGEAWHTKFAAFEIVPTHFTSFLNWLFGLGPGHGVSRLGGWILRDYAGLLFPLGATANPASAEVFQTLNDNYLATESTLFFPLFTWAGIWSDFGIVGLSAYIYLCSIVWRHLCVDDFCKFLMLSTAFFGCILTQMEEPAHMITVALLIGLTWHEDLHRKTVGKTGFAKPNISKYLVASAE